MFQAIKARDLSYIPPVFVRYETCLKDALKVMIVHDSRFAVVRKGKREVGMVGESKIKDLLS